MTTPFDSPNLARFTVGDAASCAFTVTAADIDRFADLSHDTNVLHLDDAAARTCGFRGRIAHGVLGLAAISRLIGTQLPGPGSLLFAVDVQFVEPVYPGDRLEARVTVKNVLQAHQVLVMSLEAIEVKTGAVVLRGTAKVRFPPEGLEPKK